MRNGSPRAAEQVDRMLADMQLQLLPWQRTVLERVIAGDQPAFTINNHRAGRNTFDALTEAFASWMSGQVQR